MVISIFFGMAGGDDFIFWDGALRLLEWEIKTGADLLNGRCHKEKI